MDLPSDIMKDLGGLRKNYFKEGTTSWVNEADANEFYDVANRIVDYAYGVTGGDDTEWSNRVTGLADDIRVLASNDFFDKNLPNLFANHHNSTELLTTMQNAENLRAKANQDHENINKLNKQIEKETRKYNDLKEESLRIVKRCGDLGFLD